MTAPDPMSRRAALRALGVCAAVPVVLPLLEGCHPQAAGARAPRRAVREIGELRQQLREVVATLSTRFASARGQATLRSRGGAAIDSGGGGAQREASSALVLTGCDAAGRSFEEATSDVSIDGVARAASALLARASGPRTKARPDFGDPRDFAPTLIDDPTAAAPAVWLDRVAELYRRARRVGNSRLVYRGAYLTVDDAQVLAIGPGFDLGQRLVRTRAGVLLVAWSGSQPVAEEIAQGGVLGLEVLGIPDEAIAAGAARALALFTPQPPPTGEQTLLLDPSTAALLAQQCLGPALEADRWLSGEADAARWRGRELGSARVTLIDDPTAQPGHGSYWFDDEGALAAPTTLIDRGVLARPIADAASAAALGLDAAGNGRRSGALAAVAPRPSNLAFAAGDATVEALLGGIDDGLLIEGGRAAWTELGSWRFVLRAARARRVRGGKLSGHVYADVDLSGEVPALLGAVEGASAEQGRFAAHAGGDVDGAGDGVPISIAAPFLLTRARIGG